GVGVGVGVTADFASRDQLARTPLSPLCFCQVLVTESFQSPWVLSPAKALERSKLWSMPLLEVFCLFQTVAVLPEGLVRVTTRSSGNWYLSFRPAWSWSIARFPSRWIVEETVWASPNPLFGASLPLTSVGAGVGV